MVSELAQGNEDVGLLTSSVDDHVEGEKVKTRGMG